MIVALVFALFVFITLSGVYAILFYGARKNHRSYVEWVVGLLKESELKIDKLIKDLTKERGRNKSVEVRTGFIMEKIAPFTEAFGENPKNVKHLGDPIDYICFDDDVITLIEVKTGKSRLSTKQNKIKRLVEEGKVGFKVVRYDYE